jgi:hypothetical protein
VGGACIDGGDGPLAGSPSIPNIPDLIEWRRSDNRRQGCAMLEESERREERKEGITPGEDGCIMELHVEGVSCFWAFWRSFLHGEAST